MKYLPPIVQQLEEYARALEQQAAELLPVDRRLARRMGYTFEGLQQMVASGEIPGKVGRSGGFYVTAATVERHRHEEVAV